MLDWHFGRGLHLGICLLLVHVWGWILPLEWLLCSMRFGLLPGASGVDCDLLHKVSCGLLVRDYECVADTLYRGLLFGLRRHHLYEMQGWHVHLTSSSIVVYQLHGWSLHWDRRFDQLHELRQGSLFGMVGIVDVSELQRGLVRGNRGR